MTPFKTIWPNFINVYPIDSFQHHMNGILHCVPNWPKWPLSRPFDLIFALCTNWLLSRPFYLILSMCTQLTPFNTIWMEFYIVYPLYPVDSFQDHLTRFLHSIPNWLLSRQYDLIFVLCTQLTPFKTIWPNFINVLCTYFYKCVTNWLFSTPYDLIFALCTQMTPLKTIWPNCINVYPFDSLQDQMTWFLHCIPAFINVYPIDSFQHHMTWFLHCVHNWLLSRPSDLIWLLSRPFDLILSICT